MEPPEVFSKNAGALADACRNHGVRRLTVFGSALSDAYDPATSDLDLLVEFEDMSPAAHAEHYFGLEEDLSALLGTSIDLIELATVKNPFFTQAIERSRLVVYEAA